MDNIRQANAFSYGITKCAIVQAKPLKIVVVGGGGETKLYKALDKAPHFELLSSIAPPDADLCNDLVLSNGNCLICATEDHTVDRYTFPEGTFVEHIARLTAEVRSLSLHPDGTLLAIAGDENIIKLVNTMDSSQVILLKGHKGTVKHVSFDMEGHYLASSGCDGVLCIFDTTSPNTTPVSLPNLPKSKPDDELVHAVSWHPFGESIAIPSPEGVCVFERGSWSPLYSLTGEHTSAVSAVSWSPNGRYLASAGMDLKVNVWDVVSKQVVGYTELTKPCCSILWSPTSNDLLLTTFMGHLIRWNGPIPSHLAMPFDVSEHSLGDAIGEEETEEAEEHVMSDEEIPTKKRKLVKTVQQEETVWSEDDLDNEENFLVDSEDEDSPLAPNVPGQQRPVIIQQPQQPLQPCLQQGKTTSASNSKRLLAWNLFGSITSQPTETHSLISIEFSDIGFHRPIRFNDHFHFQLASIGSRGAFFASKTISGQVEVASTISFKPFNSWAANSDWRLSLDGEEAHCVTMGEMWMAVGTSAGFVRVFSLGGTQTLVFSVPGRIISLACFKHSLCVVYECGNILSYMMMDISSKQKLYEGILPISPDSLLQWIDFSENGILISVDSEGIVRGLFEGMGSSWIPLLDASSTTESEEIMWPVGVTNNAIMYAACKHGRTEPSCNPLPLLSSAMFEIPFLESSNGRTELESKHLLSQVFLKEIVSRQGSNVNAKAIKTRKGRMDQMVLKLIKMACDDDDQFRALDLATTLHFTKSLGIAKKIGESLKMAVFVQKIDLMIHTRQQESETPVNQYETPFNPKVSFKPPSPAHLSVQSPPGSQQEPVASVEQSIVQEEKPSKGSSDPTRGETVTEPKQLSFAEKLRMRSQ